MFFFEFSTSFLNVILNHVPKLKIVNSSKSEPENSSLTVTPLDGDFITNTTSKLPRSRIKEREFNWIERRPRC